MSVGSVQNDVIDYNDSTIAISSSDSFPADNLLTNTPTSCETLHLEKQKELSCGIYFQKNIRDLFKKPATSLKEPVETSHEDPIIARVYKNLQLAALYEKEETSEDRIQACYKEATLDLLKLLQTKQDVSEKLPYGRGLTYRGLTILCCLKTGAQESASSLYNQEIQELLPYVRSELASIRDALEHTPTESSEEQVMTPLYQLVYLTPLMRGTKALCLSAGDQENYKMLFDLELNTWKTCIEMWTQRLSSLKEVEHFKDTFFGPSWYYALSTSLVRSTHDVAQMSFIREEQNLLIKELSQKHQERIQQETEDAIQTLCALTKACEMLSVHAILDLIDSDDLLGS